jgi:hypothetical protein
MEASEVLTNKYCAGCALFKRKEYISVRNETIVMNLKYFPKDKRSILFVAESPPWRFSVDKTSYFYASEGEIRYGSLAYYMSCVLFGQVFNHKRDFLQKFLKNGFYLIDAVKCPINNLKKKKEKKEAVKFCAKYLNDEFQMLSFAKVLFIGKGTFQILKKYASLPSDYDVVPLPFNSKKNIDGFKDGLGRFMNRT